MEDLRTPENWDEHSQWDLYWATQVTEIPQTGTWKEWRNEYELRFLNFVKTQSQRKVWFAGCRINVSPIFYAYAGCNVLASDVSSIAVEFLQRLAQQGIEFLVYDLEEMIADLNLENIQPLSPRFLAHDFCQPLAECDFDVVLNIKAYQGLSPNSMRKAATSFYKALKPGGHAIFDTINIQGEYRNKIEDPLIDAGFYLPFHKSERWYRKQLNSTGIVYVIVLGRPMVPRWGQYDNNEEARVAQDQEILRSLDDEYRQHREQESLEVQEIMESKQAKIAHVVYNTG